MESYVEGRDGRKEGQRGRKHKVVFVVEILQIFNFYLSNINFSDSHLSVFQMEVDGAEEREGGGRRRKKGVVYLKQLSKNSISEMRM